MVRSRYLQAQHSDPSLFFLSRAYLLRANQLILCGLLYSGGICSIVPIPGINAPITPHQSTNAIECRRYRARNKTYTFKMGEIDV